MDPIDTLLTRDAPRKLAMCDHILWSDDPTEIANRLGWVDEPVRMQGEIAALRAFVAGARRDGFRHVVWCGMGGSSLFPELLTRVAGPDALTMHVLDTSHPAAVIRATEAAQAQGPTLYVFASKSGGTVETRSHLEWFWGHVGDPQAFAVVTDPGSALDALAAERGFRAIFHANPDIGGRYSALSHFGLVAAALLDVDVDALLEGARGMAQRCASARDDNPAIVLAAVAAGAVPSGRDKLVLDCDGGFAAWLEQLVAESTGKHDTGVLPAHGNAHDATGSDRVRVSYGNGGDLDLGTDPTTVGAGALGAEVFRWEAATAFMGALLGINPFDQPDVEAAKQAANRALSGEGTDEVATGTLDAALASVVAGKYVSVQAFVDPAGPLAQSLDAVRIALRERTGAVVTAAIGPRYLHSTGQYHKGGPAEGVFVQVLDSDLPDAPVPGRDYSFGQLLQAQAAGDHAALRQKDRTVTRVDAAELMALLDR